MWWTVVRRIPEGMRVGFGLDFRRLPAKCGLVSLREGREKLQVAWVRLGGEFWAVLEVFRVLVCCERKNGRSAFSGWVSGEERCSLSLGIALWDPPPLPGCSPYSSPLLSLLKLALISPPLCLVSDDLCSWFCRPAAIECRRGDGRRTDGVRRVLVRLEQEMADRQNGRPAATVADGRREREGGRRHCSCGPG